MFNGLFSELSMCRLLFCCVSQMHLSCTSDKRLLLKSRILFGFEATKPQRSAAHPPHAVGMKQFHSWAVTGGTPSEKLPFSYK